MTDLNRQLHMINLARAALEHLEFDTDSATWRVGSYGRPFGNSYPQDKRDILFFAGILEQRYSYDEMSDERIELANELWQNLGDFIQQKCNLFFHVDDDD